MKILIALMLLASTSLAQQIPETAGSKHTTGKWTFNRNKKLTGGLIFLSGAAKGFNESLLFHYKVFDQKFPGANAQWFNPEKSWRNKYREGNPNLGPRYPLSTSVLVFTTDQFHLNNFINRASLIAALTIKIGEGKKPFKYYLKDVLFYTICYQAGFALTYLPFRYKPK